MSKYVDKIADPIKTVQVPKMSTRIIYVQSDGTRSETWSHGASREYEQYQIGWEDQQVRNIVLKWHEVKDQVRAAVERGEYWDTQPSGPRLLRLHAKPSEKQVWKYKTVKEREYYLDYLGNRRWRMLRKSVPSEVLASAQDMTNWFNNGYRSEEFENLAEQVPSAMQHRPYWSEEEGDIELSRLTSGWDDFYFDTQKQKTKPGVRVQIEMAFAAGVSQKTIEQYGAWVNSLLASMEAYGIDMVVDLWIPLNGLFEGDDMDVRTNVLIRVKNANEVSDFTNWSILFSPAGYRQIGFAAKCVAGDKIGKRVTDHYGFTIGGKTWNLIYTPDDALVQITVNQRAYAGEAIPFEKLTELAIQQKLIPDPAELHV